jgi:peptide/nickel transport system substrate-binding protein
LKKMEKKIHPLVTEANQQLREGKITRRDFLRLSTLLGLTVASAEFLAACGTPEQAATEVPAPAATEAPVVATEAPATGGIVRGGTPDLRHPHRPRG